MAPVRTFFFAPLIQVIFLLTALVAFVLVFVEPEFVEADEAGVGVETGVGFTFGKATFI